MEMTFLQKIKEAKDLIREAVERYGDKLILACSFGKDSMVLLHLAKSIEPKIKVFSVMMDTEFENTYQFAKEISENWRLSYKEYVVKNNPDDCCGKAKVEKTKEVLSDYDAWLTGVRSTEGITRNNFHYIEEDKTPVKINPILEFTEAEIWRYLSLYGVSVNREYKNGYRSLGCKLCSAKEQPGDKTEREGRWRGTKKQGGECGIHTKI